MASDHSFAPLWDTDDLAVFLKLPAKTIREWRHKGTGPRYARLGKHVRYRQSDVMAWLNETSHDNAA
jgi:excisionase family DNA binding protein